MVETMTKKAVLGALLAKGFTLPELASARGIAVATLQKTFTRYVGSGRRPPRGEAARRAFAILEEALQ